MLKRIYVDNYKCLVNFEIELQPINLFMGVNGSGKSAVFEVLQMLSRILNNQDHLRDVLNSDSLTRWGDGKKFVQTFELDIEGKAGRYRYHLSLEHQIGILPEGQKFRILKESLTLGGQALFNFDLGEVQLYRDNSSAGPSFPSDWGRSALASVPARNDNQKLAAFKKHIEQLLIVHPIPIPKSGSSGLEEEKLDYYARKFVPWYRYLNDDGRFVRSLSESLETVFEGFESISTPQKQGVASFILRFRPNGQALEFDYNELSDGQRMLIILYSLLHLADHGLNDGYPFILCIDEPENAVTLREIQPWLSQLSEVCHEGRLQAILISQHPSSINYLGGGRDGCGYWFDRPRVDSHSLIKRVNADLDDLSLSQLMERGWFDPNGS